MFFTKRKKVFKYFVFYCFYVIATSVVMTKDIEVKVFFQEKKNCKLCKLKTLPRTSIANSTPRDAILFTAINKMYSLVPFVRALRSTGSQARVLVFLDNYTLRKYPSFYYKDMNECGVEFISIAKPNCRFNLARFNIYADYLDKHASEFDRIIQSDLFDAIVQYDPFSVNFKKTELYLQPEPRKINTCKVNTEWATCAYDNYEKFKTTIPKDTIDLDKIKERLIVNGGGQAGGVDLILKFDRYVFDSKIQCPDQGIINFMYYSGIFEHDTGIKPILPSFGNELFAGIALAPTDMFPSDGKDLILGEITIEGKLTALIHQIDRHKIFKTLIPNSCPNEDPVYPDYLRPSSYY